jgi:hypothetical protein
MLQTKVIKYNLRERGRQYRGRDRKFDVKAIVDAINGGECQERVKCRDMAGYYGHWPRVKFGLNPAEGGLEQGKPALVEPALVTTMLRASPDGTIEHQAEFLDTAAGKVAAKLYKGRVGGFSSAIDTVRPEFHGFDYVLEPNYSTNRGWALDDVSGMSADDVDAAIYDEQLKGVLALLDSVTVARDAADATINRLLAENEELLSALAARGIKGQDVLDGVATPISGSKPAIKRLFDDREAFLTLPELPSFVEPQQDKEQPAYDSVASRLVGRFLNR